VALLETLDIAIHDTTNDKTGLNYNLVDHSLYRKILVSPDVRKFFQLCIEWIQVRPRSDGMRAQQIANKVFRLRAILTVQRGHQLPRKIDLDEWKILIGDLKSTTLGDVETTTLSKIVYEGVAWPSIRRELDFDNKIQRRPLKRSRSRTEVAAENEIRLVSILTTDKISSLYPLLIGPREQFEKTGQRGCRCCRQAHPRTREPAAPARLQFAVPARRHRRQQERPLRQEDKSQSMKRIALDQDDPGGSASASSILSLLTPIITSLLGSARTDLSLSVPRHKSS
jgi:hypothetical protein